MNENKENTDISENLLISKNQDLELPSEKMIFGAICGIFGYMVIFSLIFYYLFSSVFQLSSMNPDTIEDASLLAGQIMGGVVFIEICILLMGKQRAKLILKGFFEIKNIIIAIVIVFFMIIVVNVANMFLIEIFKQKITSENQNGIEEMLRQMPVLGIFLVAIIAPLTEELTFRYFLFNRLKKNNLIMAFVVSIAIFVATHFLASLSNNTLAEDLISLPLYIIPAIFITFVYYKNKNFATPVIMHVLYNTISILMYFMSR